MKKNEKMEIVLWLKEHGYKFFGERPDHFANRFDLDTLKEIQKSFTNAKNLKISK